MQASEEHVPFRYAADADYAPLIEHRKLAEEVDHIRSGQKAVARQNTFRREMGFVQAKNDLRRARWWSLAAYSTCSLAALAVLVFTVQPRMQRYWRTVSIALLSFVICLAILGHSRDGRYARLSWTRLRFKGPRTAI